MSSIADAKAAIYQRLASAPTFHPSSVDLFSDWTLQGGDIITVESDSDSYNVPIYGLNIKWNGTSKVVAQSTGNQTRPVLEKMAEQKFSSYSAGGVSSSYRSRKKTNDRVQFIVGIDENGDYFIDHPGAITLAINEADESYVHVDADHLYFTSNQTAQDVCGDWEWEPYTEDGVTKKRLVLKNGTGLFKDRNGQAMVLYDDGNLTGKIAINKINGESVATINAQRIKIGTYGGSTISLNDTFQINPSGEVYSPKAMRVNALFNCVDHLYLSKGIVGAAIVTDLKDAIYDLKIVPPAAGSNVYTLQKQLCDPNDSAWKDVGTFSRATALSGEWSGNSSGNTATYTVVATPQNEQNSSSVYLYIDSDKAWVEDPSGNTRAQVANSYSGGGTIDIPSNQIYTTSNNPQGTRLNILRNNYEQARSDGDYVCFRVDCGSESKWYYMEP